MNATNIALLACAAAANNPPPSKPVRACSSCKHFQRGLLVSLMPTDYRKCERPNRPVDPVTGNLASVTVWRERNSSFSECGKTGKLWEAK